MIRALIPLAAVLAAAAAEPRFAGRYAVVLDDPPVLKRLAARESLDSPRAREYARAIRTRQAAVRQELERRGFRVTAATELGLNALFVAAGEQDGGKLRGIPGVRRMAWLPRWKPHLSDALDLVNVPIAWGSVGGEQNAGAGVKIAILDTGIDHTHPAFDDPSLQPPAGAPYCAGTDCAYTNRKVIAARSYVAITAEGYGDRPESNSRPDDLSPRDHVGHGTALAMIAAGRRVQAPLASISGIAPKAFVGNYKLYGSPGVNDWFFDDALFQALEDARRDGMDIAVLAFGGPALWGPLDKGDACGAQAAEFCDLRIEAIENIIRSGLTVVISAGNSGDISSQFPSLNTIAAPATAPSAITVGATQNRHAFFATARVATEGAPADLRDMLAQFGDGPRSAVGPAPVRDVAALGNDGKACAALPPGSLAGAIALVARGDCFFSEKVRNVRAAGAAALLVYLNPGQDTPFSPTGLSETPIPTAIIGNARGESLKNFLRGNPGAQAVLDPALRAVGDPDVNRVADLSSRGPSIGEFGVKPEVVAPGTSVYTATQHYDPNSDMFDPSRYIAVEGTSFAAPMAAGVAALVKQRNSAWGPVQLKSAVVNTATPIQDPAGVLSTGAGKINAEGAVKTNITVEPATVSFGAVGTDTKEVRLTIRAPAGISLGPRLDPGDARLNLVSNAPDTVVVQYRGPRPDPGVYSGTIVVTGGTVDLRVPYVYFVGDNVPFAAFPLGGDNFDSIAGESLYGCNQSRKLMTFKLVDRYGVPVDTADGTVFWSAASGGGRIIAGDPGTDKYGIAGACVQLGPGPGEQSFKAEITGLPSQDWPTWFGAARVTPTINANGVVDAASNTVDPTRGLAPGSYATIYGIGLADFTRHASPPAYLPSRYLPMSLAGTSVSFDVPSRNISVAGRLLFVSPTQLNVQIPWELEGLTQAFMKVSIGDWSSAVYTVPLTSAAPQLYQYAPDSDMRGFAIAQRANTPDLINFSNPARKGEWLTVYANGLGPVTPAVPTGEESLLTVLHHTRNNPSASIGGRPAEINFSGLAPGFIGLYQINVRVPQDAPGGSQPIVINMGGVTAQPANVVIQ